MMIKARMRSGASWNDVCILNASLHGLVIQMAQPPGRGTYVEIRRGRQTIVGRIAWARGHRAGLRSQDPIFIKALTCEAAGAAMPVRDVEGRPIERRRAPRAAAQTHESSRLAGRAAEFACFVLVACALGVTAFGAVREALARPISAIEAALT